MENRLKMGFSRLFRSSFSSCRSKNINTDVFEKPVYLANDYQHRKLIEIFSPKHYSVIPPPTPTFPSINSSSSDDDSIINNYEHLFPRRKLCGEIKQRKDVECQIYPHAKDKVKRSKRRSKRVRSRNFWIQEFPACNYNGLFSSDEDSDDEEEDDNTTLFSSESSERPLRQSRRSKKNGKKKKKKKDKKLLCPPELLPEEGRKKKVESGGFAVVKRSKDPYSDFMSSMVEMIMEKQIFAGEDLEKLLQCFLSLNSDHHHRIIIQVFKEIWDALFTDN